MSCYKPSVAIVYFIVANFVNKMKMVFIGPALTSVGRDCKHFCGGQPQLRGVFRNFLTRESSHPDKNHE